jgi:hypothetical protein
MNLDFKYLTTLEIISKNFNIDINFLNCIVSDCSDTSYIKLMNIRKKNKKRLHEFREVIKINQPFNIFYKELLSTIELTIQEKESYFLHKIVHGFVKKKNILSNASEHLNKKYIFKVDIKNFFNSISETAVEQIFVKLGCESEGAKLFASLCTYEGVLKEGFNTSPILANLYCFNLDKDLIKLASSYNIVVTRYSDDITFSSDKNNFPTIEQIKEIFARYNFKLNENKTIFHKKGQPQYVTGLSISNTEYPRVPRVMKKKIRQHLHYFKKYPDDYFSHQNSTSLLRFIYGNITYILGIEKELGKKYQKEFLNILTEHDCDLSDIFMDAPSKSIDSVYHFIDETEILINGNHYLALSIVSIKNEELKNLNCQKLEKLKMEIISDYRNGLTNLDKENLFHYAENNIYVKEKYLIILRELQFEAFIIFTKNKQNNMKKNEYQKLYYLLSSKILFIILRRFSVYNNIISFEENSKISKNKLEKILTEINGLPKFTIHIATKDEILLSIPDYVLGIFRECMKKDLQKSIDKLKNNQSLNEEKKLNEIVDKIRLVIDVDNKKYYSRKDEKVTCLGINKSIMKQS